ncbi:hypothetical protein BHE90_000217 [Fusarium euwallaceae]|uniref:Uncharacterized protein n=1 Tax=Fusarium euwallaceae TaxID=1147111 RepID=A0A430MAV3_9HYPO|nr:hypothetical protein BHE90_000217 [Fusarium euwallaceae]
MLLTVSLISSLVLFASAKDVGGAGNLTVAFFTDDQPEFCEAKDTSKGIILTTSSIPTELTCFNLTDVFSQSNETGFQEALEPLEDKSSGVNWLLQNRDDFDSKANYSQIRYELLNKTTEDESGEVSAWSLYVYAFSNCQQIVDGDNVDADDFPWFESTCQTEKGGECQVVPYPIKSFAIVSTNRGGECEAWAKQGSAAKVSGRVLPLVSTLGTVSALFLVL